MKLRMVLLAVVALALAAWLFLRGDDARQITDSGGAEPASALPAPSEMQVPPAGPTQKEPHVEAEPEPAVAPAEATPPVATSGSSGILLYGFVLPIAGTQTIEPPIGVTITDRMGEMRRSEAGSDGAYSYSGLTPGRYWINAGARNEGSVRAVVDLDAASGERRLDLRLERASDVQVEVVDLEGRPLADAWGLLGIATLAPPGDWCDEVAGSLNNTFGVGAWTANGQFGASYDSGVLGRIRLAQAPPVYVSLARWQRVLATERVEAGATKVRFVLDPKSPLLGKGSLTLRLVDSVTREPLPKVPVTLDYASLMTSGATGDDGVLRAASFPGWLRLRVNGERHGNPDLVVRLEAGADTDLGDVALEPAVAISGRVVDDEGRGIQLECECTPSDALPRLAPGSSTFVHKSAADGSFRIAGLARQRYRLKFRSKTFGAHVLEVDTRGGDVENLSVVLARGVPLLVSGSDERWPLVRLDILDAQGVRVVSTKLYGPEPRKILLAPGRYEVEVRVGDAVDSARRTLEIGGEPVELSLP